LTAACGFAAGSPIPGLSVDAEPPLASASSDRLAEPLNAELRFARVSTGARQLAAMMLTDMVGYSALAQRDERLALTLVREQERIVRRALRSYRGRTVKTLGDGFLAEFPNALDAVECAVGIQRALEERNSERRDGTIQLRIGIHLGDVVHRDRDVFGDAVNVVARIEPLADPGGVCLSQPVYDQVRNNLKLRFESLGLPELKHIETPIPVYRILLPSAHPLPVEPSKERPRVAVLPLANISGSTEDEYFADGITEQLIQMLSKITGLRVIGRTSVMRYKRSDKSPAEIARELGVASIVEGGIRKSGTQVRVTARLLDGKTAEARWSQEFNRRWADVFALQSDISRKIAGALEVEILGGERKAIERPFTGNPDAHASYLKGRALLNQRTAESLRAALGEFRTATRKDPTLAEAHAGIADAYSTLAWLEFVRPRQAFPRARTAALTAVRLDGTLAEARASLGFVRFLYDRAWVEAEAEFRRSIALNPNYSTAHQYYSDLLKALGRMDEALTEVRRALELDPLSLGINTALGHVLYLSRRYDDAIVQYRRALELDPAFVQAHLWFGRPYLEKGMYDAAIAEVETAVRLSRESTMSLAVLGHAHASAGHVREAKAILAKLVRRARTQYVPSYWIALVHTGLGDASRAISWLERADRERSAWLAWIKVEPRFDRLRPDPRFARLLRRVKLS
jgi:adenylate cyclase